MANDSRIGLGYSYDKQSEQRVSRGIQTVQTRLDKLADIQRNLAKRLDDGTISLKAYQKGLKATDAEAKQLQKSLKQLSDTPPPEPPSRLQQQNDRFDRVSRDVGLAGDVQSNLGAIQGLGDAAGFDTGGIGVAGEVVVLAEELPRLKESIAGLPQTIGAAAQSLGVTGGIAVAGLAAIALAIKVVGDAAEEQAERLSAQVDNVRDVNQQIANGLTSNDIQQRLQELQNAREAEAETLNTTQDSYNQAINDLGVLGGVAQVASHQEAALAEQIGNSQSAIADYDSEIELLTSALESSAVAANDATAAEKERGQALLEEANLAGQTVAAQERARNATVASNESRLQSIDNERAAIEAQIAVLQSSGNTSEEVTDRIAELNGQLNQLGQESSFIKDTALDLAKAREQEAEAQKQQEKAQQEAQRKAEQTAAEIERAEEQIASARRKVGETTRNARKTLARANQDITRDLDRTFADIATETARGIRDVQFELANAQFEAQRDADRDEAQSLRAHLDTLTDIREDALNSEEDLFRGRDFLGLRDLARDTDRARRQQETAQQREEREREIQLQGELRDIRRDGDLTLKAQQQEAADARRDAQQDARRKRQDAQLAARRSIQDAQQAAQAEIALAQQTIQQKLQLEQQYAQQSLAITQGMVNGAAQAAGGAGAANPNALRRPQSSIAGTTISGVLNMQQFRDVLRGKPPSLTDELGNLGF